MPFGQKLTSGIVQGFNSTKNLLQKVYHHGKQTLGMLDKGFRIGGGIYNAVKPALQHLAPEAMQSGLEKLDTQVNKAQDKYNTLRNKIDSGEQKIRDNVGMVMGNPKKNKISMMS